MADRLHLPSKHRRVLEALLRKHLPDVEVWAYGSRVNGRSHNGSDLDLVLRAPDLNEISTGQLGEFEEAVRESNIPFLVEARDWARLPERFRREIEREYVVLVAQSSQQATHSKRSSSSPSNGLPGSPAADFWEGSAMCRRQDSKKRTLSSAKSRPW